MYTVQDWEIIEPASFDQLGRGDPVVKRDGERKREGEGEQRRESPTTVSPREKWCRAVEQLIMLHRMEKENQTIMSENTTSLMYVSYYMSYVSVCL